MKVEYNENYPRLKVSATVLEKLVGTLKCLQKTKQFQQGAYKALRHLQLEQSKQITNDDSRVVKCWTAKNESQTGIMASVVSRIKNFLCLVKAAIDS